MTITFLDTNALLKLYLTEKGTPWLKGFVSGQQITISELALFEVATVLRRLYTEGAFTRTQAIDLFGQLNRNSTNYQIILLGGQPQLSQLVTLLFNLPTNLRIRSLDSIHLTAAHIALQDARSLTPPEPFVFVSSDVQLLRVAQAMGFVIENPEDHP